MCARGPEAPVTPSSARTLNDYRGPVSTDAFLCFSVLSNYAPGLLPQQTAAEKGYSQILWLLGNDHQVTEVGTMNCFMFWINEQGEKELITPPLDGTILPGVTRDSVLSLARQWNEFKVSERPFTMPQVAKAVAEKRVRFNAATLHERC
mgnify:CR=1 FL=1